MRKIKHDMRESYKLLPSVEVRHLNRMREWCSFSSGDDYSKATIEQCDAYAEWINEKAWGAAIMPSGEDYELPCTD
jgi:hypothetical protein